MRLLEEILFWSVGVTPIRSIRPFLSFIVLVIAASLNAGNLGIASAEESCPSGSLPFATPEKCLRLSQYTKLPLDVSKPMVFEAIQVSMAIIYIQAIGTITPDTPQAFQKFLKTDDAKLSRQLDLHSPGGHLMAGLTLGEMIRKAGYNTSIGRSMPLEGATNTYTYKNAICASACAYAFLGGVSRSYGKDDLYGLHRFGSTGKAVSGDDAQLVSGIIANYIERMGASQAILQAASSASFEKDIFPVPVALGEQMRIIYDASGETIFQIEDIDGRAAAKFDFSMRERSFRGILRCVESTNILIVIDRSNSIPEGLQRINNAPTVFIDGSGRKIRGSASYVNSNGTGAVIFKLSGITADSFSGDGLRLDNIWNNDIERRYVPNAADKTVLYEKFAWLDNVNAFAFRIKASNGSKTLPLVLRECTRS